MEIVLSVLIGLSISSIVFLFIRLNKLENTMDSYDDKVMDNLNLIKYVEKKLSFVEDQVKFDINTLSNQVERAQKDHSISYEDKIYELSDKIEETKSLMKKYVDEVEQKTQKEFDTQFEGVKNELDTLKYTVTKG